MTAFHQYVIYRQKGNTKASFELLATALAQLIVREFQASKHGSASAFLAKNFTASDGKGNSRYAQGLRSWIQSMAQLLEQIPEKAEAALYSRWLKEGRIVLPLRNATDIVLANGMVERLYGSKIDIVAGPDDSDGKQTNLWAFAVMHLALAFGWKIDRLAVGSARSWTSVKKISDRRSLALLRRYGLASSAGVVKTKVCQDMQRHLHEIYEGECDV